MITEIARGFNTDKNKTYKEKNSTECRGHNYIELYEKYFAPYLYKPISLMEIGIAEGYSLELWGDVFVHADLILGLDYNHDYLRRTFSNPKIKTDFLDQGDIRSLSNIETKYDKFDIIIDDGSHQNKHIIDSFQMFFPMLKTGGIYVVEDIYQSYHPDYVNGQQTFISYIKERIDDINSPICPNKLSNPFGIQSVHFYNDIVFILQGDPITW